MCLTSLDVLLVKWGWYNMVVGVGVLFGVGFGVGDSFVVLGLELVFWWLGLVFVILRLGLFLETCFWDLFVVGFGVDLLVLFLFCFMFVCLLV